MNERWGEPVEERGRPLARRSLLRGAALTGGTLAGGLAGCAGEDPTSSPTSSPSSSASTGPPSSSPTTDQPGGAGGGSKAGLGPASAVDVGGGVIYAEQGVVVTQPTRGEFKAFDATCTHQGCPVGSIKGGEIECPCHYSRFSVADGTVVSGPASTPLEQRAVSVRDGRIALG